MYSFYVLYVQFFMSQIEKRKSRKIRISYFLIYHVIIFGNLYVQLYSFYVPKGCKGQVAGRAKDRNK